jgi:hypothetical protein
MTSRAELHALDKVFIGWGAFSAYQSCYISL